MDQDRSKVVDLLNTILRLEYSIIVHMPQIAGRIEDEKTRELALSLGTDSVAHADAAAATISGLGGTPEWAFEPVPYEDLKEIFTSQLEKEEMAMRMHQECATLLGDDELSQTFKQCARDEADHMEIVKTILSRLG